MFQWKRIKSATEWGFFMGVLSWLLSTGISNKIPTSGVWAIILSRMLSGFIIGTIRWNKSWWISGLIIGGLVNIPLAMLTVRWPGFNYSNGFWPAIITGMICGLLIEMVLKRKRFQDSVAEK